MNHRISHFAAIALMVLLSFSCSRGEGGTASLRQALAMYGSHPDSALAILHAMDKSRLDGREMATYALVHSMAQDKSGVDVTDDSLLRIAYDFFVDYPTDTLYARCMYYMGKYYLNMRQR